MFRSKYGCLIKRKKRRMFHELKNCNQLVSTRIIKKKLKQIRTVIIHFLFTVTKFFAYKIVTDKTNVSASSESGPI
jgi:hypothetical protein